MGDTNIRKLALLVVMLLGVASLNGCLFVNAHFTRGASGGTDAIVEMGVLKAILEADEVEGDMNIGDEGLVKENWEEPQEFDRGEWHVTLMKGHAEAGESLFKEESGSGPPEFTSEKRLFTTVHGFALRVPTEGLATDDDADEEEVNVEVEGFEGLEEMMGDLAGMMAGGGEPMRFACTLPGVVFEHNGNLTSSDTVGWQFGLSGEGIPEGEVLSARSRLINWEVIGAVGSTLVEGGRHDLVLPLIAGAQRGVIPDPIVAGDPLSGEVDVPLYVNILDIMVALDGLVGEEMTDQVMVGLGLNGDEPDAAMVERVLGRLSAEDYATDVNEGIADGMVQTLGAP